LSKNVKFVAKSPFKKIKNKLKILSTHYLICQ